MPLFHSFSSKRGSVKKRYASWKAVSRSFWVEVARIPWSRSLTNGVTLRSGIDYTVSYQNNVKAGKATVIVAGKGNYSGKASKTFTIGKASLRKASITVPNQRYKRGKAVKPKPKVKLAGKTLKLNCDYAVSYQGNKKRGKATLTVKGKGNYTGTASKKFAIK